MILRDYPMAFITLSYSGFIIQEAKFTDLLLFIFCLFLGGDTDFAKYLISPAFLFVLFLLNPYLPFLKVRLIVLTEGVSLSIGLGDGT